MTPAPLGTPPSLDDTFTQLMGKASEKGDLPASPQSPRTTLTARPPLPRPLHVPPVSLAALRK